MYENGYVKHTSGCIYAVKTNLRDDGSLEFVAFCGELTPDAITHDNLEEDRFSWDYDDDPQWFERNIENIRFLSWEEIEEYEQRTAERKGS